MFAVAIALWSALGALAPSTQIYRFRNVSADFVMSVLAPVPPTSLPPLIPSSVSWVVDPNTNSVLVRGPKEALDNVLPFIKAHDVRSPKLELSIQGKVPSIKHEQSQSLQLTAGSTGRIEEPGASLEVQLKVLVANPEYAVLQLEHKFRGSATKFTFRIRPGETVSLTPDRPTKGIESPKFELKVKLARVIVQR